MLLFWSSLIVDGDVVRLGRWERWNIGLVGKVGRKVGQGSQQSGKTWKIILFSKSQGKIREKNKIMTKSGNFKAGHLFLSIHLFRNRTSSDHNFWYTYVK